MVYMVFRELARRVPEGVYTEAKSLHLPEGSTALWREMFGPAALNASVRHHVPLPKKTRRLINFTVKFGHNQYIRTRRTRLKISHFMGYRVELGTCAMKTEAVGVNAWLNMYGEKVADMFIAQKISTQYQVLQNNIEMEVIDEEESALIVVAVVLLLPNPRMSTPWQALFASQNDRAFITTMGFEVETFAFILTSGFAKHWYHTPIPRDDISHLQQIFALIPTTVSRYLSFDLRILLLTLRDMADAKIHWLHGDEFEECSALVVARHARLQGAFGSIDGLKLPVQIWCKHRR
ncbi:hypothetical protein DFH29DRAFT_1072537 [Suillus ampliporus]|nr:hypothetical protein DFH29DRAFT_1072537 [Suillus ampliporus]